jgi:hypothetical protein
VEDAQLLLAYIAHDASVDIDHETLDTFVQAKYMLQNDQWTPEAEIDFHVKYDRMAKIIEPVTIESLRATIVRRLPLGCKIQRKFFWFLTTNLISIKNKLLKNMPARFAGNLWPFTDYNKIHKHELTRIIHKLQYFPISVTKRPETIREHFVIIRVNSH